MSGFDFDVLMGLIQRAPAGDAMQRYKDYRKVFLGSEDGLRVLSSILADCHMFMPSVRTRPIDPYATHIAEGERNVALRIMKIIVEEPKEKPTRQRETP